MIRRDRLWKRIWATILTRRAVRVVFVGPSAQPDPRIERAREKADVRPMDAAFFDAIKDFISLTAEKQSAWSQTIKPKADAAMSALWTKLWKTPEGRRYQELKVEVDRRKSSVDALCRKAEDGITKKVLASGQVVTYLKTSILIGNDELLDQARQSVEKLKHELTEAKERLKQLEKGQEAAFERINLLVVEELKGPAKPKAGALRGPAWSRVGAVEAVQQAMVDILEIDEMIADEMAAVDNTVGAFVAVLENVAQQQISEEELQQFAPETEEEPAEVQEQV